jgi:hypothetical protein
LRLLWRNSTPVPKCLRPLEYNGLIHTSP